MMHTPANMHIKYTEIEEYVAAGKITNIIDCKSALVDLPSLVPIISAAALPLVLSCSLSGTYDISLVESNKVYLKNIVNQNKC